MSANVSHVPEFNSTSNSTELHKNGSSLVEREADKQDILEMTNEDKNSTNSTNLEQMKEAKVERGAEQSIGNVSISSNVTIDSSNHTINVTGESANSTTGNPWSALPLFRNMSSTVRSNLTEGSGNSSQTVRDIGSNDNSTMDSSTITESENSDTTDSPKFDWLDELDKELADVDNSVSKKPCGSVACSISRGCTDEKSCTTDN